MVHNNLKLLEKNVFFLAFLFAKSKIIFSTSSSSVRALSMFKILIFVNRTWDIKLPCKLKNMIQDMTNLLYKYNLSFFIKYKHSSLIDFIFVFFINSFKDRTCLVKSDVTSDL